jgi:hypothetical protein
MLEMFKHGRRTLKQKIYKLICNIWNTKTLPAKWNEGIICPIYKKGERLNCNNYRPITENKLGDFQMAFPPNRSTTDNTFMVRQIYEKCYEYNIELHNIFVD